MKSSIALLVTPALLHAGEPVSSAPATIVPEPSISSGWEITTALYVPLMGLDGKVGVAGFAPAAVDLSFGDVLENMDGGLSGAIEFRKDRFFVGIDAIWLKLSDHVTPTPLTYVRFGQDQLTGSILTGYDIYRTESTSVALMAGAAVNDIDVDLELYSPLPPIRRSGSQSWIDPFFGVRVRHQLGERWTLFAEGVYGGFDVSSEEYWQALAGVGYQLTENTTLALAYRIISVDYQQGGFVYDTDTAGPNIGLIVKF
jgi:opacity protein-like surface antigen